MILMMNAVHSGVGQRVSNISCKQIQHYIYSISTHRERKHHDTTR